MNNKVVKIEEILSNETDISLKENKTTKNTNKVKSKRKKKKEKTQLPQGLPKSGRIWKNKKKRFSSIIKTRGYKIANKFEKLQILKKDIEKMRELTRTIVEEKAKQKEEKKERRRINLQRQKVNQLKSEVVQVIKNSAKIKRMRKKQLRNIEKRDTLNSK